MEAQKAEATFLSFFKCRRRKTVWITYSCFLLPQTCNTREKLAKKLGAKTTNFTLSSRRSPLSKLDLEKASSDRRFLRRSWRNTSCDDGTEEKEEVTKFEAKFERADGAAAQRNKSFFVEPPQPAAKTGSLLRALSLLHISNFMPIVVRRRMITNRDFQIYELLGFTTANFGLPWFSHVSKQNFKFQQFI